MSRQETNEHCLRDQTHPSVLLSVYDYREAGISQPDEPHHLSICLTVHLLPVLSYPAGPVRHIR